MLLVLMYRGSFKDSYVPDLIDQYPLTAILGIPLLFFGCLFYLLLNESGKFIALLSSLIYLIGFALISVTFLYPLSISLFFFLLILIILGFYIGYKLFMDLKTKNYL